jgi:hypothetical protein
MKIAVVIGSYIVTSVCYALHRHHKGTSRKAMESLEYMQHHEFDPPITEKEAEYVRTLYDATSKYLEGRWLFIAPPPKVHWDELPMDKAYLNWIEESRYE